LKKNFSLRSNKKMEYIKVENGIVIAIIDTDNPKKLNLPENNEGVEGKGK
jgi:hypothetical protein